MNRKKHGSGFLIVEAIMVIVVLAILLGAMAVSLNAFGKFNKYQFCRQQCVAAAQAQLDSIVVSGKPLEKGKIAELWRDVTVSVEESNGVGQWAAMKLITAAAYGKVGRQKVEVRLSRYVPAEER